MRAGLRQLTIWAAVYLIALQAILAGLAFPLAASAATFDPTAVICHSDPQDADSGAPANPPVPPQNCSHCVLCNAAPAADLPILVSQAVQPRLHGERISYPALTPPIFARVAHHNLARGPPPIV